MKTAVSVSSKSSDQLLSLINYRAAAARSPPATANDSVVNNSSFSSDQANSQVFEIFKFNRGWKTRLWCIKHNTSNNNNNDANCSQLQQQPRGQKIYSKIYI